MNKHCILTMSLKTMSRKEFSKVPRKLHRNQGSGSAKTQKGSALIIAVFIIIVISMLGASLASLQRDSAQGTSYEIYAARAYLAAYSAGEIALARVFPLKISGAIPTCTNVDTTATLPNSVGFHGCTVNYICAETSDAIATRYKVSSTAVCKNAQINTRRQITVEATDL